MHSLFLEFNCLSLCFLHQLNMRSLKFVDAWQSMTARLNSLITAWSKKSHKTFNMHFPTQKKHVLTTVEKERQLGKVGAYLCVDISERCQIS